MEQQNLLSNNESVEVNEKDHSGKTQLHWAVSRGDIEAVQDLVSGGAYVNAIDSSLNTPLHFCGDPRIAVLLINQGAISTLRNKAGLQPLDMARRRGLPSSVLTSLSEVYSRGDGAESRDDGRALPCHYALYVGLIIASLVLLAWMAYAATLYVLGAGSHKGLPARVEF